MQTFPDLLGALRCLSILLINTFIVSGLFLPSTVHAGNGSFVWAKAMGGNPSIGFGVSVDSSKNSYTTGYFEGTVDFDPGPDTFNLATAGEKDIFITKLDSMGNLVWAKAMGGTASDAGLAITLDSSGNVYIAGTFSNTVDFGPTSLTSSGGLDIFVSKLNSNGSFVWTRAMGAAADDLGVTISLDNSNNVYTAGTFAGTVDFDPGSGVVELTSTGVKDSFITKMNSNGDHVWAKAIGGGTSETRINSISLDSSNNAYITGSFEDTVDFDPGSGSYTMSSSGQDDIFIAKINSNGTFAWARAMGATSVDEGAAVALDTLGNVYATGTFSDTVDFDPGSGTFNLISSGGNDPDLGEDIFICKLDGNGNFVWARAMGGTAGDAGQGIFLDNANNVYTAGSFQGTVDFDPGPGTFPLNSKIISAYISKLNSNGTFAWARAMGGTFGGAYALDISLDTAKNVYATGAFFGPVDFDPGPGTFNLSSAAANNTFNIRLNDAFPWPMFMPAVSAGRTQ